MKGSFTLLKRHAAWIAIGFVVALAAEFVTITIAVNRNATLTRSTLALVTFASFAVVAAVHFVRSGPEQHEPVASGSSGEHNQDLPIAA
jgi:hypothetical protein